MTVSAATLDLDEGGSTASYTVALDSAPTADVTVTATSGDADGIRVHGPGGTAGASATLTFTPTNWSAQTVTVTPEDDTDADDETITISHTVSDTGGYDDVTAASVTVTVDDDETPTLSVDITPASANEGDAGSYYATVTLNLNPARSQATTFKTCLANTGTATHGADADYQLVQASSNTPLSLTGGCHDSTIAAHTTSGQARLLIHGDTAVESDETVMVDLRDPPQKVAISPSAGSATYTILNDDAALNTCVPAQVQSDVEGYAAETQHGAAHVARWKKVLKTFAGETEGMTGAEARQMEKTYSASRWHPVAKAIECLEAASQPASVPEIAVSGGAGVTEGTPASFTVTADPAPAAPLTVALTVGQDGDVAAAGATGAREIVVPTGGSVTLDVATVDDGADEPDGAVSVTVDAGDGYTVGASPDDAASVAVADDDTAANPYAALIAKMVEWRNDPKWKSYKAHTDRWDRALLAFGESVADASLTPMTAAAAQAFADRGWTRWVEVAYALQEIENGGSPDPVPEVTVSGGNGVTEGDPASFTVTADPTPTAPLTVALTVGQDGDVAAAGATGAREVVVPTGGSVTLEIATVDDAAVEPDGAVSVTIDAGNGYTVGSAQTHTVSVADDDTGPAAGPELSLSTGPDVDEGGNAEFTITANPAPQADLTVEYTVAQSGEVLSTPAPASRTVTLTAGATSTTLTLATAEDDTNEPDGTVTVTLEAGTDYTVAAGQASGTVTVRDNDQPVVSLTAGTGVTEGDPASFTLTATPAPAAPLTVTLTVDQSGDYAASGQTGSREIVVPTEGHVTVDVATDDDDADEPDGSISATLTAGSGYTVAASPDDTATVTVADNDDAAGVPSLSVVDGQANENEGRLPVIVRLSPPSKSTVSVWAKTRESSPVSAREGVDYRVWNARWGTRIDFRPGETERRLAVAIINDSHDEDPETFEVVLSDPSGGAAIADGVGVMTIVNSDPMPKAWLSRFGRTVAQQALDGITGRLAAPRTPGAQGTLAGQAFTLQSLGGTGTPDATTPETPLLAGLAALGLPDLATGGTGTGAPVGFDDGEPGRPGANGLPARTLTLRDVLLGSSFSATGQPDAHGGSFAFWGRAAQANFEGREGTFALDGETTTAMLGTDYARDRWLLGVSLLQSTGTGGYDDPDTTPAEACADVTAALREVLCGGAVREGAGSVESTLTAAVPYAAFQASERLKLWGAAGYGAGEVTLTPETGGTLKTDLSWSMAELGLRGQVLAPADSGPALAVTSDALWTRTSSEKVQGGLAASESDVTRLRLGLEGRWLVRLETLGQLTPTLAVGARHDGGDAETGFGVELGGGLAWNAPRFGLALNLEGRTLLTHRDEDFQDQGVAASFAFDPDPATPRGPSLTVRQDWGGQATGGVDALFAADPLTQRQGTTASSRWAAEAAWGFPAFGDRFTGSPHLGVGLAPGTRDYSLGWRLVPATPASALSLDLQATRRELDAAQPEHRVGLEITTQW